MYMYVKKKFLNPETLQKYGFETEKMYGDSQFYFTKKCRYSKILIQRNGEIAMTLVDDGRSDCAAIDVVVYQLIKDGLVECGNK